MKKVEITLTFDDGEGKVITKKLFGNPWTIDNENEFTGLVIDEVTSVISSSLKNSITNTDIIRSAISEILKKD
jgi:hypothetical protein